MINMSNVPIPKGQQTAYQRWEMSTFADDGHSGVRQPKQTQTSTEAMNAQQVKAFFENARKEGYAQGMKEGYFAAVDQEKAELEQSKTTLINLAANFNDALQKNDEKIAENLLKLALDIAKAMLKTQLMVNPLLILPIVKEAINYLPIVKKPARILLHPQDAATVKKHMLDELAEVGWLVLENYSLERGDCMVETAANQIDATNDTRWRRISDALGQTSDWAM